MQYGGRVQKKGCAQEVGRRYKGLGFREWARLQVKGGRLERYKEAREKDSEEWANSQETQAREGGGNLNGENTRGTVPALLSSFNG